MPNYYISKTLTNVRPKTFSWRNMDCYKLVYVYASPNYTIKYSSHNN